MLEYVVNKLFTIKSLREAIFAEVHFYDQIDAALKEPTTNLTWEEGGKWYGYTFNEMHKIYLFDDTGHDSMSDLWDDLWRRDSDYNLMYR
jgi:hypothetical protein